MRNKCDKIQQKMEACNIIASGSKGNCEIYCNSIAIDMGIPFSKIKSYLHELNIVLLSHLHLDHFNISTIKKLSFERPSLRFACGSWMAESLKDVRNVDILELNKWYDYGQFKVSIGSAFHDIENCFFRLDVNGYKIFRVTDTGHLYKVEAKDYDLFALEHNYDAETIDENIAKIEAKGGFAYQKGAANTHLSMQQANEFIFNNRKESSQVIRLHESENN